jgi:hypothetical protein
MRTAVEISLNPQVIEVQEISTSETLPDDKLFESLLIINQDEFNQIIKSYKLPYQYNLKIELYQLFNGQSDLRDRSQTKFNKEFTIDERPKKDDKDFKEYLQTKINAAFKNPQLIERYFEASDNAQITHDEGRDIHDGLHVARVALYSKMLLNLYRKYKDHFPENLQKEIEEFDERKEKDLEILCLMHDCARVDKAHDQNEYKNAFYAALIMRRLGDPRFSGDTISQEGLDLITNLSLKESEDKDKSLMSKLIQSADSLAITRVKKIIFDKDYIDATHDFYKIENSEMQSKILNEMNQLAHLIRYHEYINRSKQVKDGSKKLEFSENPYGDFKARIDSEQFLQSFELARDDLSGLVPVDSDKKISQESYFVHVVNTDRFSGSVLDKFNKKKFLNGTYILEPRPESKGAYIRHYANVGWYSHYFLIFNQNPDSGVVFLTGFQRDIVSDFLSRLSQDAQNDFELIKTFSQKAYSSFGYMVFSDGLNTLEEFRDKIHEIMLRKTDKELDISDQEYMVSERVDLSFFKSITKVEKIGKDRYNSAEFNMYKGVKIRNPQLIHNECHIYGAIHNVLYVGVAKDFLQDERMDSDKDFFGLKKIKTLMEAKEVSERINNEKRRLAELEEPIQDEGFKFCVNHEFRRIKTCLEKIIYLTRLRDEIRYGDHDIKDISMIRKERKQTATGQKFIDNHQNREIWRDLNIDKISRDLVVLYKELKSYESEESFGIKGLKEFVESLDYKDKKDSQQKINSWIDEIMDGKTQSHVIEKVVNKIKVELKQEVKVVSQDMRDPTNLVELDDDFLSIDKEFKRLKKELDRFNKDTGSSRKNKDDQDLVLFGIFLQHESQYIMMYKYFQDKEQREKLFSEYKKRMALCPKF